MVRLTHRVLDAASIREANVSRVYRAVSQIEGLTRADLALQLGMSRSTASSLVQTLLDLNVLCEDGRATSKGGRRATKLRPSDDQWYILGTDLGATHIGTLLMTLNGEIRATRFESFDVRGQPLGAIDAIESQCHEILGGAGIPLKSVIGLGIAVPSPVSPVRPGFVSENIMPLWEGINITTTLESRLGVKVILGNDANMGAFAESRWGIGQQASSLAYIKIGTGAGCGLIINDRIHHGAWGFAGELGHLLMTEHDAPGQSLNDLIGKHALQARYQRLMLEMGRPVSTSQRDAPPALLAQQGDPVACTVIAESGRWLGRAVADMIHLMNPEMVILGGSLAVAGDLLLRPVQEEVGRECGWKELQSTRISLGQLGERGIATGAAGVVLQAFEANICEWIESTIGSATSVPRAGEG